MLSPWLAILLVLSVLAGVMAGLKLVSARCHLHPETSRKGVHIVMGLVTLSFPWLFAESWPVLLLTLLAVAALAGTRLITPLRERFGGVLNGVERHSLGEVYFPLAVAVLFLLAAGNRLLYMIPLLTLTLADAVAALVGVRYGQHRYATSEGTKSAEGSLAFFLVAFLSAHVPLLLLSDTGRAESLLVALVLGILVMLFEAISVGGLDNLFIPLGCYALLRRYLSLGADELLLRVGAICLLALVVFAWRRRTTLKESGLLAAALVGYMNWALGGWQWLAVSLVFFLTYTHLWPRSTENSLPVHTVRVVASVAAPGMVWLLAMVQNNHTGGFLAPFALSYAAHSVMVGMTQLGYARPGQSLLKNLVQAVSRTWMVFLPLFLLPALDAWGAERHCAPLDVLSGVFMAVIALPLLCTVALLHRRVIDLYGDDETAYGRWMRWALVAFVVSLAAWALYVSLFGSPLTWHAARNYL
jgi:phytol kinase